MKSIRLTKIFFFILCIVLLVGSATAIASSADASEGAYDIEAINIAHSDTIKVLIAVDAPMKSSDMGDTSPQDMPAPDIEVKYTIGNRTKTATYWHYVNIYGTNVYYPVYYTDGIAIKDCGESVVAEAHATGTAPSTPKYRDASVSEYLYARLYKDGYMFLTEDGTKAQDSKNFYINMLYYIASAQQVLWNDKTEDTSAHKLLVTDKVYAYADDGYITDVDKAGGFVDGTVTVNYTGTAPKHIGWYVESTEGTTLVIGNEITLDKSARLTPCFDTECTDFEAVDIGNGLFASPNATDSNDETKYKSSSVSLVGTVDENITFSYYPSANLLGSANITTANSYIKIAENSGNRYLEYSAPARSVNHLNYTDTASLSGTGRAYSPSFEITVTDAVENPNMTVFEFDLNLSSGFLQILFSGDGGSSVYPYINNTKLHGAGGNKNESVADISYNTWAKIRYEYFYEEGVTQIYVNGVYRGSSEAVFGNHNKPTNIGFGIESNYTASFKIDNVYARNLYKTFDPEPKAHLIVEDFSSNYTPNYYEWTCNHSTYLEEITAGKLPEGITADTKFNATSLSFPSGIYVDHGAAGASVSGYSNVHGSSATVLTDENGNKYINLYSPTRVSARDRAYSLTATPQSLHPTGTENLIYVFDFDLKLDSDNGTVATSQNSLELLFYSSSGAAQFGQSLNSDGDIVINGAVIGARDVWHSLRFEIYPLGDSARIKVLKKDSAGVYKFIYAWTDSNTTLPLSNLKDGVQKAGINPLHPASINVDNIAFYTDSKEYTTPEIAILYKAEGKEVLPTERIDELKELLIENSEIGFHNKTEDDAPTVGEIVIGKSSRPITATAEALIEEAISNSSLTATDLVGYSIYVENGSVAIAWSDFRVCDAAFDTFERDLIKSGTLTLVDGYVNTVVMSLSDYLYERGNAIKEEAWEKLSTALPEAYSDEIVKELKELYALYGSDMISWMASLYTPIASVIPLTDKDGNYIDEDGNLTSTPVYPKKGGFYNSESPRDDTTGFYVNVNGVSTHFYYGPDIENTYEGVAFMSGSGMAEMFGDSWAAATPDWLGEAICNWYYDLEDLTTTEQFFYNPQWPKEYIQSNNLQSRITRDRGSVKTVLRSFGYTLKSATVGKSSTVSSSYVLTDRLMYSNAVLAAAKAVALSATSQSITSEYDSFEAFKAHIDGYAAQVDEYISSNNTSQYAWVFYLWGNEFQSTTGYMTAEMKEYLYQFFEKYQDPATGMWIIPGSSLTKFDYNPTNAIHKVGSVYNSLGKELKYTDQIIESTIEILSWTPTYDAATGTGTSSSATAIYNAWSCFPYVYNNILKNSSIAGATERQALVDGYKNQVFSVAPELIEISKQHIELCKHDNGGFSYNPAYKGGLTSNQGCPAGTGVKEPDMNGNSIATVALVQNIFGGLGVASYQIPIFTEYERNLYINLLEEIDNSDRIYDRYY